MNKEETNDNLHFTLFQNNRSVSIDAFVMEKTNDGFMRETYGYTETEHEMLGRNRRKVLRMFNHPRHYCVEPSPEFGCPLPEYCVTAWISSGPIPDQGNRPSKMVIVFFCDYIAGMSIEGLFTVYLYNLDWDTKAWTDEEIVRDREMFDWFTRD